jgi:hypothetical protein
MKYINNATTHCGINFIICLYYIFKIFQQKLNKLLL